MNARASAAVTEASASSIAPNNSDTVRLASFRSIAFTFAIAFSIGLKSGEYGGSRSTTQPDDPLAGRGAAVRPLHLRVRPELVEEHQAGGPHAREPPARPRTARTTRPAW